MATQFDEYVKAIIEEGSFVPGAFLMIPLLSIDANGKAQGDIVAILWAQDAFDFITKGSHA